MLAHGELVPPPRGNPGSATDEPAINKKTNHYVPTTHLPFVYMLQD